MDEIRTKLDEEIASELEKLKTLEPGSKEHSSAVADLATLYRLSIDETEKERTFVRNCDRDLIEEREYELKIAQFEDQKKDRWWRIGLEAAGIVLPLTFYGIWMVMGLNYEKEGTFTSKTFQGLTKWFKPTKK